MATNVHITKANGEQEPFERAKLEESLKRSGADEKTISRVADAIEEQLTHGMTTHEIYRRAFNLLKKQEKRVTAAKYSLRRSLLAFGPSGYPFEALIGELFRADGYDTKIRVLCRGKCVGHEIDLRACKDGECIGAEVKFHNAPGIKSDAQDALYVDARFRDIVAGSAGNDGENIARGMLITNTKFTHHAIAYAECVSLELIGWGYPRNGDNLERRIERTGLHPITCIPSLPKNVANQLLQNDIVLCRDLKNTNMLAQYGVSKEKQNAIREDIDALCI